MAYSAPTDAGMGPRSLTGCPVARAQALTSEVLGAAAVRDRRRETLGEAAGRGGAWGALRPLAEAPDLRVRLAAPAETGDVAGSIWMRVTAYSAPSTRSTSSSGSVESMVIFMGVAPFMCRVSTSSGAWTPSGGRR